MEIEKPVSVKPGRSKYKLLTIALIAITAIALIVVIVLAAFYALKEEFTKEGVEEVFQSCDSCTGCLSCLSPFSGKELNKICAEYSYTFQCSSQVMFLYSKEHAQQPCQTECRKCRKCLQETAFGYLEQRNHFVWDYYFPNLFKDPTSFDKQPTSGERERAATIDACCQTSLTSVPYDDTYVDSHGTSWYPVWFNIPWKSPRYSYQYYNNATCLQTRPGCDSTLTCNLESAYQTFLMTKLKGSSTYGYTYTMLILPSTDTEFISIPLPHHCQCAN